VVVLLFFKRVLIEDIAIVSFWLKKNSLFIYYISYFFVSVETVEKRREVKEDSREKRKYG